MIKVRADAKNLAFDVGYNGPVPAAIHTDPTRLRQILINLIGNAIKFTETGGVRLEVRFEGGPGPVMHFDVIDTGIGMSPEQVDRIFKPFGQGDRSTARQFGGTGLGLAISKRFAQILGGDIALLDSTPGAGSRFRATVAAGPMGGVKMIDEPSSATIIAPDKGPESPQPALNCRVLLAEDALVNQRLISGMLQKAGMEVRVAENGKLAVEMALAARDEGSPFAVVLMDMQMPVMDGYEAVSLLRRRGYDHPIIALTAHAMAADRERCLKAGCDDYTTKPVERRKLIEMFGACAQGTGAAAR